MYRVFKAKLSPVLILRVITTKGSIHEISDSQMRMLPGCKISLKGGAVEES